MLYSHMKVLLFLINGIENENLVFYVIKKFKRNPIIHNFELKKKKITYISKLNVKIE